MRRRAVVLLEPDDLRAGEIALEAQDVADLGAAPAIDRLVVVADAAEIAMLLRQQPQPQILRDVGVLVLVDQDVAEAVADSRPGCRAGSGRCVRLCSSRSPKSAAFSVAQPLLVEPVELDRRGRRRDRRASAAGTLSGVRPRSFQRSIAASSARGGQRFSSMFSACGDLLHQAQLVVGVEDGEIRLQPHHLGMAAQDARGDRMEGAEPQALGGAAPIMRSSRSRISRAALLVKVTARICAGQARRSREDMREPRRSAPGSCRCRRRPAPAPARRPPRPPGAAPRSGRRDRAARRVKAPSIRPRA